MVHGAVNSLEFKVPSESIDASYYLPIFLEGIRERTAPYRFVAFEGAVKLLEKASAEHVAACLPDLIYPLKFALEANHPPTIILALRALQTLCSVSKEVGEGLVPFYRQLLPTLNKFKNRKRNLLDQMDFAQFKHDGRTMGEAIEETLTLLERFGGADAFINIKYIVPTYESYFGPHA
jgi:hypothetical protein